MASSSSSSNVIHNEGVDEKNLKQYLETTEVKNRDGVNEAKVITFYSHKGGVGKTTNCHCLGYTLAAKMNKVVLMIDLDPQMNLSILATKGHWASNAGDGVPTWTDIIKTTPNIMHFVPNSNEEPDPKFIKCVDNLYLLFGSDDVSDLEHRMITSSALIQSQTENYYFTITRVNRLIQRISTKFDYIVIDLSPSYNTMVRNVIGLSHGWFLSCLADEFSIQAVDTMMDRMKATAKDSPDRYIIDDNKQIQDALEKIKKRHLIPNPEVKILGFILNRTRHPSSKGDDAKVTKATEVIKEKLSEKIKLREFYFNNDVEPFVCNFPDFTSVNVVSQNVSKPVAFVTKEDYKRVHEVRQRWTFDDSRKKWESASKQLAERALMI